MQIELAAAEKVVDHHASNEPEEHQSQQHQKQELGRSKPRWVLGIVRFAASRHVSAFSPAQAVGAFVTLMIRP